jgi:hypothetical protein
MEYSRSFHLTCAVLLASIITAPFQQLFHINGTAREKFVPRPPFHIPAIADQDAELATAIAALRALINK